MIRLRSLLLGPLLLMMGLSLAWLGAYIYHTSAPPIHIMVGPSLVVLTLILLGARHTVHGTHGAEDLVGPERGFTIVRIGLCIVIAVGIAWLGFSVSEMYLGSGRRSTLYTIVPMIVGITIAVPALAAFFASLREEPGPIQIPAAR
jgi:hypothetical protein